MIKMNYLSFRSSSWQQRNHAVFTHIQQRHNTLPTDVLLTEEMNFSDMEYFDDNLPILLNFQKTIFVINLIKLHSSFLYLNNFLKVLENLQSVIKLFHVYILMSSI